MSWRAILLLLALAAAVGVACYAASGSDLVAVLSYLGLAGGGAAVKLRESAKKNDQLQTAELQRRARLAAQIAAAEVQRAQAREASNEATKEREDDGAVLETAHLDTEAARSRLAELHNDPTPTLLTRDERLARIRRRIGSDGPGPA